MCVFICANPTVRQWLEVSVDHAARESFQLCPVTPGETGQTGQTDAESETCDDVPMRHAAARIFAGSRLASQRTRRGRLRFGAATIILYPSPPPGQKPLEFFTEAWSRLLLWFGWSR